MPRDMTDQMHMVLHVAADGKSYFINISHMFSSRDCVTREKKMSNIFITHTYTHVDVEERRENLCVYAYQSGVSPLSLLALYAFLVLIPIFLYTSRKFLCGYRYRLNISVKV